MPQINGVTTKSSQSVWKTPDGQRELFEVIFDYEGQEFKAKTWSGVIAKQGWSGDIVTEERPNKQGNTETFVKQPPKEGGWSGAGQSGQPNHSGSKPGYVPKDEKAIQAMWAISQAITANKDMAIADAPNLDIVENYANRLFEMVDRVKTGGKTPQHDTVVEDEVVISDDTPVDLSHIDDVWGNQEAKKWVPNS